MDEFPLLYHAHHALQSEDLPLWLALADQAGDPLLELGCGTGRVLIPLAQAGHQVYGLDRQADMLIYLRQRLPASLSSQVHIWQGDMLDFCLGRQFPLILLPCNTLSTLSGDQRRRVYRQVRQHLQPGGIFAASLPNPATLLDLPDRGEAEVEEVFPHPLDGEPVQVSSAWRRDERGFHLTWHYDHLLPDGRVQRTSLLTNHALQPAGAYLGELQAAGFHTIQLYGDFDRSSYSPDSPALILIAA